MKTRTGLSLFLILFMSVLAVGGICALDLPRITPGEYIFGVRNGYTDYDGAAILEASLRLSGVQPADIEPYAVQTEKLLRNFDEYLAGIDTQISDYEKGEEALTFLHERLFREYSEFQTRTHIVFDTGVYNCVSSAVFYVALLRNAGMTADAVSTDDHVFCSVVTERGVIDVETTSLHGFDPGVKREFTDSFGKTGFTYVPPGNYSKRKEGDLLDLLSFILQNRIAELQKKDNYFDTVGLAVDRYALLGDAEAKQQLITELVNYAASLNKDGRYLEGIEFLDYADDRYNPEGGFADIYSTLTNNAVVQFTEEQQFQEAVGLIDDWKAGKIVTAEGAADLEGIVYDRQAFLAVQGDDSGAAEDLVKDLHGRGKLTDERYTEFIVYLYGKQAEAAGRKQDWLTAAGLMDEAINLVGDHPQLTRAWKGYRDNYAIRIHNQFAGLFNAGEYGKAKDLVTEALALVPESRLLQQDLEAVGKALGGDG